MLSKMTKRHLVHAKRSLILGHIWSFQKYPWRHLVHAKRSLIFGLAKNDLACTEIREVKGIQIGKEEVKL